MHNQPRAAVVMMVSLLPAMLYAPLHRLAAALLSLDSPTLLHIHLTAHSLLGRLLSVGASTGTAGGSAGGGAATPLVAPELLPPIAVAIKASGLFN
jgi:hypothetical protein